LRRGAVHFDLSAHFLQAHSEGFDLLLLPRFEIARVLVRLDHVPGLIVHVNHGIM
jgi:hypothetical protein